MTVFSPLSENTFIDTSKDAVSIEHVSKIFKKPRTLISWPQLKKKKSDEEAEQEEEPEIYAVNDVSLAVRYREIVGILGANGSGKSTLIRMISTLLIPDAGTIHIFGYDVVRNERTVQPLINRVSVEASFFKKLSPMENLLYAARLYNMSGAEARVRIKEILLRLGIKASRIDTPLENMSRGMQQKVAIARAFLTSPVVLLLDEPTTGLDPRSKIDVQKFVHELREEHNATILLTTHDMDEVDALCDRVAIIDKGRIVAIDENEKLKSQVAQLMGRSEPVTMHEVFMYYTISQKMGQQQMPQEKDFEVAVSQYEED